MATFGSLSVVPWILFAQSSWNMDAVPVITAAQPQETRAILEIQDRGEVFGREAEQRARSSLREAHRRHRIPVLVETVPSLDGAWIADVAQRRARMAGRERLYILVAREERDVGVVGGRLGPASRLTDQQRETIRRAFLGPLQAGNPDGSLEQGIGALEATFATGAGGPWPGVRNALVALALVLALAAVIILQAWVRGGRRNADDQDIAPGDPVADPSDTLVACR